MKKVTDDIIWEMAAMAVIAILGNLAELKTAIRAMNAAMGGPKNISVSNVEAAEWVLSCASDDGTVESGEDWVEHDPHAAVLSATKRAYACARRENKRFQPVYGDYEGALLDMADAAAHPDAY